MKINDFIQNFANQFDETDASEFQATTEFRQLDEWSSLSSLAIISMIDDEYDVVINGNEKNPLSQLQYYRGFVCYSRI